MEEGQEQESPEQRPAHVLRPELPGHTQRITGHGKLQYAGEETQKGGEIHKTPFLDAVAAPCHAAKFLPESGHKTSRYRANSVRWHIFMGQLADEAVAEPKKLLSESL